MSSYTDLTSTFEFNRLITWQDFDALGENDNYIRSFYGNYRRPVLKYASATQFDIENNTGTANETRIVFPDGTERSVTEDTSSAHKFRRFDITATATYVSGTEDSGLRSGVSEVDNTWYCIYAIKSQINTSNFILSGDSTIPKQSNIPTLDSRYGENSWVYLGLIRNNGDFDITKFTQAGNRTVFRDNSAGGTQKVPGHFIMTGSAPNTYTISRGTGNLDFPDQIETVDLIAAPGDSADTYRLRTQSGVYAAGPNDDSVAMGSFTNMFPVPDISLADDIAADFVLGGATLFAVVVLGYTDHVLGPGFNPQI